MSLAVTDLSSLNFPNNFEPQDQELKNRLVTTRRTHKDSWFPSFFQSESFLSLPVLERWICSGWGSLPFEKWRQISKKYRTIVRIFDAIPTSWLSQCLSNRGGLGTCHVKCTWSKSHATFSRLQQEAGKLEQASNRGWKFWLVPLSISPSSKAVNKLGRKSFRMSGRRRGRVRREKGLALSFPAFPAGFRCFG